MPSDVNASGALAAYLGYENIGIHMDLTATFDQTLADYSDLSAFAASNTYVTYLRSNNLVNKGTLIVKPTVTAVQMNASPMPIVTLTSCIDARNWHGYYVSGPKKGQSLAPSSTTAVAIITVHRSPDGKWRVTDSTGKKGATC